MDVMEVKEGEYKGRDRLTGRHVVEFIEDEKVRQSLQTIGYFAFFELVNGFTKTLYWSLEKMEAHANTYSKAFKIEDLHRIKAGKVDQKDMWKYSSYWYKDFDGMAFKTLLRQLISKWVLCLSRCRQPTNKTTPPKPKRVREFTLRLTILRLQL